MHALVYLLVLYAVFVLPHHLGISRTASLLDNVTIVGIISNTI